MSIIVILSYELCFHLFFGRFDIRVKCEFEHLYLHHNDVRIFYVHLRYF